MIGNLNLLEKLNIIKAYNAIDSNLVLIEPGIFNQRVL